MAPGAYQPDRARKRGRRGIFRAAFFARYQRTAKQLTVEENGRYSLMLNVEARGVAMGLIQSCIEQPGVAVGFDPDADEGCGGLSRRLFRADRTADLSAPVDLAGISRERQPRRHISGGRTPASRAQARVPVGATVEAGLRVSDSAGHSSARQWRCNCSDGRSLAKSRNQLLFRALDDEEWVLWLDVDVIEYPDDVIQTLLACGKDILQPHCVLDYGGPKRSTAMAGAIRAACISTICGMAAISRNCMRWAGPCCWCARTCTSGRPRFFPPFLYGRHNPRIRGQDRGELETEGLGIMANDMGARCWGMPRMEILHLAAGRRGTKDYALKEFSTSRRSSPG